MPKLSKVLQLIFEKDKPIFTSSELTAMSYSSAEVYQILKRLERDKIIYKITRGVYSREDPETLDTFYLAQKMFSGYLGFASACFIYGWLEYMPFEIYIVTSNKSERIKFGKFMICSIALKNKGVGGTLVGNYIVSSKAKTIFDILYKPDLVGGYVEALKVIYNSRLKKEDWNEFLEFALKFGSKSFLQRAGYLLTLLKKDTKKRLLFNVQKLKPKKMAAVYIGSGKVLKYSREWNVFDCLGSKLTGWYDGT